MSLDPSGGGPWPARRASLPTLGAVILDFDGLIIDTETPIYEAWTAAYREHGLELSFEVWQEGLGTQRAVDLGDRLATLLQGPLDVEALRHRVRSDNLRRCGQQPLLPGVLELVREARRAGLKTAVATSSSSGWVEGWLGRHRLRPLFDAVVSRDDVPRVKPAPDLYLEAARRLGVEPSRCLAFEDSPNGVRAARGAGMRCIAVPNPLTRRLDFPEHDARIEGLDSAPLSELARGVGLAMPEPDPAASPGPVPLRVPTFVVIGGGDVGLGYVRQLRRAVAAGRLVTESVLVVDRDPACLASAAAEEDPRVRVEVAEWSAWLEQNLDHLRSEDHLVPYHWAPHLLMDWLAGKARRAGATVARGPVPALGTPFERETSQGDRALSYATWSCPPTCIEPELCPHTCGLKDWSLAAELEARRDVADEAIVFRCLHLVWGVGTIPVAEVRAARDRVLAGLVRGRRRYLVATSSHCHALAATLDVTPEPARVDGAAP